MSFFLHGVIKVLNKKKNLGVFDSHSKKRPFEKQFLKKIRNSFKIFAETFEMFNLCLQNGVKITPKTFFKKN